MGILTTTRMGHQSDPYSFLSFAWLITLVTPRAWKDLLGMVFADGFAGSDNKL